MVDSPLKIFLTDPHLKGGGQVRYVTNLARELVRRGHQVTIGCKPGSVLIDKAREADCHVLSAFVFKGGLRTRAWWRDVRFMREMIRGYQPDILHANGSQDHWVAAIANRTLGRPVCVVRARHNTYTVADHLPNRIINRRWTDYQIVVCDVVRRDLSRQKAFDGERMCSIHNGVDADLFRFDEDVRNDVRAELGYQPEDIVVGIAARLVLDKGHQFLFKAIAKARETSPNLRLLVLGEGRLDTELRELAATLRIDDITHFAGYRDDMPRCVQAIDIGVQPSIDCDTSSFSLKEIMAAGKPVIASDHGGLPEVVDPEWESALVPAGSIDPLANAIRTLASSPELRDDLGRKARERVEREFTVQAFTTNTLDAYRHALEVHRERTPSR